MMFAAPCVCCKPTMCAIVNVCSIIYQKKVKTRLYFLVFVQKLSMFIIILCTLVYYINGIDLYGMRIVCMCRMRQRKCRSRLSHNDRVRVSYFC